MVLNRGPRLSASSVSLHCVTGDDTGLVKRVGLQKGVELRRWGAQAAGAGVGCLSWGPGDDEALCGAGMQTGAVRFWQAGEDADDAATCEYAPPADAGPPAAMVGLRAVGSRVVACDAEARVMVWAWAPPAVGGAAAGAPLLSFQAGKRAATAVVADDGARLATGGREVDLSVWDLERGEASYRARNLPNDNLDLQVPIWTTVARFVPQLPNALAVGTGFVSQRLRGEVRLYDVAAGRRPVARQLAPLGEEAVSALGCTPDGRYVIAGSVSGALCRLDVRKSLQPLGRYKGAAGSVRAVVVHPSAGVVACAGLDRMVRVYEVEGGALRHKAYLKHRLTALLLSAAAEEAAPEAAPGEEDVGQMLAGLQQVAPEAEGEEQQEGEGEGEGEGEDDEDDEAQGAAAGGADEGQLDVSVTFDGVVADDDSDEEGGGGGDEADEDEDDEDEDEAPPPAAGKRKGAPKRGPGTPSKKRAPRAEAAGGGSREKKKKKKKKGSRT